MKDTTTKKMHQLLAAMDVYLDQSPELQEFRNRFAPSIKDALADVGHPPYDVDDMTTPMFSTTMEDWRQTDAEELDDWQKGEYRVDVFRSGYNGLFVDVMTPAGEKTSLLLEGDLGVLKVNIHSPCPEIHGQCKDEPEVIIHADRKGTHIMPNGLGSPFLVSSEDNCQLQRVPAWDDFDAAGPPVPQEQASDLPIISFTGKTGAEDAAIRATGELFIGLVDRKNKLTIYPYQEGLVEYRKEEWEEYTVITANSKEDAEAIYYAAHDQWEQTEVSLEEDHAGPEPR